MLPPLHRVDAPIQFVHGKDLAWDMDRINAEIDDPEADGDHPVTLYFAGETRYDLDAGAREYFKEGAKPLVFHMRRLPDPDWMQVRDMKARGAFSFANEYALRVGLTAVVDGDENFPLEGPDRKDKRLTEKDVKRLREKFGRQTMNDVGAAVITASDDLFDREKKA